MEEQIDLEINKSSLSRRGLKASTTVLRQDFEIFFEAVTNLYDKETNPDGTFPMNIAENKLNWKTLKEKIGFPIYILKTFRLKLKYIAFSPELDFHCCIT